MYARPLRQRAHTSLKRTGPQEIPCGPVRCSMRKDVKTRDRIGLASPFLTRLQGVVVEAFGDVYPELAANREQVAQVLAPDAGDLDAPLQGPRAQGEDHRARGDGQPDESEAKTPQPRTPQGRPPAVDRSDMVKGRHGQGSWLILELVAGQ